MQSTTGKGHLTRWLLWITYAVGSLLLLFSLLLSQLFRASEGTGAKSDFTGWAIGGALMVATLLLGWKVNAGRRTGEEVPPAVVMQGLFVAASIELAFALYAMATLAVYR
jgi:hypothetical protein